MTTKVAPVQPCNELGEIVVTTGSGTTNVTGFLGEGQIPIDDATGFVPMVGFAAPTPTTTAKVTNMNLGTCHESLC